MSTRLLVGHFACGPKGTGASRVESLGASWRGDGAGEGDALEYKRLTPEEAQRWRQGRSAFSVWHVVAWQAVLTLLVSATAALVAAWGAQPWSAAASVAYGALAALLPTVVTAWGLSSSALERWLRAALPAAARAALAVWWWEGVKVLLALAMLLAAPRWITEVNWLGLLAGLVVVLKSYWLAWIVWPAARSRSVGLQTRNGMTNGS